MNFTLPASVCFGPRAVDHNPSLHLRAKPIENLVMPTTDPITDGILSACQAHMSESPPPPAPSSQPPSPLFLV